MVGYLWGQLVMLAIPEENFANVDWRFLNWLIPLAVALGKTVTATPTSFTVSFLRCVGGRQHRKGKGEALAGDPRVVRDVQHQVVLLRRQHLAVHHGVLHQLGLRRLVQRVGQAATPEEVAYAQVRIC